MGGPAAPPRIPMGRHAARESHVKPCHHCDYHIPDHAADCPHCRRKQKRGEWLPQVVLVMAAGAAAAAVLLEGCPSPLG